MVASRAYQGVPGGEGEWGEFVGEIVVEPGTLPPAPRGGRRRGAARQRRAHGEGGPRVGRRARDLGPRARGREGGRGHSTLRGPGARGRGAPGARRAGRRGTRPGWPTPPSRFELADSSDGPALLRAPVAASAPGADGARVAKVSLAGGLLPPGEYAARAEVSVAGKPVAVVTPAVPRRPAARAGPRLRRAPLAEPARRRPGPSTGPSCCSPSRCCTSSTACPRSSRGPVPPEVAAAIEEARPGPPRGDARPARRRGARRTPRAAFLRGVSYYARGDLPAALAQLQARAAAELGALPGRRLPWAPATRPPARTSTRSAPGRRRSSGTPAAPSSTRSWATRWCGSGRRSRRWRSWARGSPPSRATPPSRRRARRWPTPWPGGATRPCRC